MKRKWVIDNCEKKAVNLFFISILMFFTLVGCGDTSVNDGIAEKEVPIIEHIDSEVNGGLTADNIIENEKMTADEAEMHETMFTMDRVIVRSGGSLDAEIINTLDRGSTVNVVGSEGEWKIIEIDGQEGFIREDFLTGEVSSLKRLVVIDAGHQKKADTSKEPIGPGATETKAKVAGGTSGVSTGMPEFELNLLVAKKLKTELESRHYEVIMCREDNDVNISNSERAKIANENRADAFIRIHANGSENGKAKGMMTICQTPKNPYNSDVYEKSKFLAQSVLDEMVASTGAQMEYVWETDSMSGINWSKVPVTIVEMGYMTNKDEDELLASDNYQDLIAKGIADGIDIFFSKY